jgi:hypothetical protein
MKYLFATMAVLATIGAAQADTVCTPDGNGGYRCVSRPNSPCPNSFSNNCR